MGDRTKEKEELMEKVFGKNAPKRTLTDSDLEILKNSKDNEISKQLDILKQNSEKIKQQTEKLESMDFGVDLDTLKERLKSDFSSDFEIENEESVSIVSNQVELNEKFQKIEDDLNKKVLFQKDYISNLCKAFKRPMVTGQQPSGLNCSILVTGKENTGRHSSIEKIVDSLNKESLLTKSVLSRINLEKYQSKEDENNFVMDVYGAINNSQVIIFDNIDSISPSYLNYLEEIVTDGVLSLSKRYVLTNKQLVEATNSLAKNTISQISFKGKYLVFITTLKFSKLLNVVGSRFINSLSENLETKEIKADDCVDIFELMFEELKTKCLNNLNLEIDYPKSFKKYVEDNYNGDNAGYVVELLQRLYTGLSEYKLRLSSNEVAQVTIKEKNDKILLNKDELEKYLPKTIDNALADVQKELDNIVGLEKIKNYIFSLQDFYKAQELRKAKGLSTTDVSKHMIFTGNPGTGKTTIARLLAKYFKAIGILSNGQLIEVSRSDLVGKYVGHTAPLTMQVIKSALGGILFIDEAYSLYRGSNDSFGLECIDTLVKAMEDNRDDLIVILAGYTKEMKEFLESNSGLQSRFPNQIEFPDYTGEELFAIAKINAKSAGYRIDEGAEKDLVEYFNQVQANDSVRSGNGRLSRNVVEEAIVNQSKRIIKGDCEIDLLIREDFNIDIKGDK